jgi:hypothetical protein
MITSSPLLSRCGNALVVVSVLALTSGCGSGRVVVPVSTTSASLTLPARGSALESHEAAVRGISAVMVKDLGLPVPERVTVYVYRSRDVFEQGLIRDANLSPVSAAELSDFAMGIGRRGQVLLNEEPGMRRGREWLRLMAHELTHVTQIELARGEGRGEQWLAEGMAEWVAFAVLERFGLDSMARRRQSAAAVVLSHRPVVTGRLGLETLGTPRGFTARHRHEGSLPTYRLAFLLTDYLIAREGLGGVVEYFRLASGRRDREAHFRRAFGQTLAEFEGEALRHLATLAP